MRRSPSNQREPLPPGFATIWTTVAIDLVGFGIVLPILPQYAEQFSATPFTIGLLVASFSLAQLVFAPVWGRLSDHIGRRPVLLISLFGTAIGSALTGAAGSMALLFVGRILDGASGASVSVAQAAVADVAPARDRARLMGLLGAAFGVGFVAGPAIGAVGALVSPRAPFFMAAAISTLNGLAAIRRLPETSRAHGGIGGEPAEAGGDGGADLERAGSLDGPQPGSPAESGQVTEGPRRGGVAPRERRAIMRFLVVSFVGMVAFSGFEATFALLTDARYGLKLSGTGAVFTVIGLGLVAVQAGLVGRVNDRLGEAATLRGGLLANAVGLALLAVNGGWVVLVASLTCLVVGQGLIIPTLSSAVAGRAGASRGSWLGWQQSAGGLARVVGPILGGAMFEHFGWGSPYLVGSVLALLAMSLVPAGMATPDRVAPG